MKEIVTIRQYIQMLEELAAEHGDGVVVAYCRDWPAREEMSEVVPVYSKRCEEVWL